MRRTFPNQKKGGGSLLRYRDPFWTTNNRQKGLHGTPLGRTSSADEILEGSAGAHAFEDSRRGYNQSASPRSWDAPYLP